jgi:hypothetical protein
LSFTSTTTPNLFSCAQNYVEEEDEEALLDVIRIAISQQWRRRSIFGILFIVCDFFYDVILHNASSYISFIRSLSIAST